MNDDIRRKSDVSTYETFNMYEVRRQLHNRWRHMEPKILIALFYPITEVRAVCLGSAAEIACNQNILHCCMLQKS